MVGPWEIKFPPPISPVRPGDAIQDRKAPPKRPRRHPEPEQEREPARDDDQHQIDDYA
jgi:hypothetical protein